METLVTVQRRNYSTLASHSTLKSTLRPRLLQWDLAENAEGCNWSFCSQDGFVFEKNPGSHPAATTPNVTRQTILIVEKEGKLQKVTFCCGEASPFPRCPTFSTVSKRSRSSSLQKKSDTSFCLQSEGAQLRQYNRSAGYLGIFLEGCPSSKCT